MTKELQGIRVVATLAFRIEFVGAIKLTTPQTLRDLFRDETATTLSAMYLRSYSDVLIFLFCY